MVKYTINDWSCQERSLERSHAVLREGTSNYRRKDINLSQRTAIALDLLSLRRISGKGNTGL